MFLKYNFHTHTKRCGHAVGEDEEYVINAIKAGIKVLGFSDHVMLPGIVQHPIRADYSELEGYIRDINALKEKYKDQITIYCGFECEYFDDFIDYYKDLINSKKIDYVILGQHFYFAENGQIQSCTFHAEDIVAAQTNYIKLLIKGIKTHLFKYVCHPDVFALLEPEWTPEFEEMSHQICKAAEENNIPLEINLNRTYKEDQSLWKYPNENFWRIASQYNVKVVVGVDAHNPDRFQISKYDYAEYLIKKYNLKFIEDFSIE